MTWDAAFLAAPVVSLGFGLVAWWVGRHPPPSAPPLVPVGGDGVLFEGDTRQELAVSPRLDDVVRHLVGDDHRVVQFPVPDRDPDPLDGWPFFTN